MLSVYAVAKTTPLASVLMILVYDFFFCGPTTDTYLQALADSLIRNPVDIVSSPRTGRMYAIATTRSIYYSCRKHPYDFHL